MLIKVMSKQRREYLEFKKMAMSSSVKASRVDWYGTCSIILIFIFEEFEKLNLKSFRLKEDIREAMGIIQAIEESEWQKLLNNHKLKYESYRQSYIDRLNFILKKAPICVGVDFAQYSHIWGKEEKKYLDKLGDITKKVAVLRKRQSLSKIRFFPFTNQIQFPGKLDDRSVRQLLSIGLFDYIQKLILKEPFRARKCKVCGEWFLFSRSDQACCGRQCKDAYYQSRPRTKRKRRDYMRKYRENRKRK